MKYGAHVWAAEVHADETMSTYGGALDRRVCFAACHTRSRVVDLGKTLTFSKVCFSSEKISDLSGGATEFGRAMRCHTASQHAGHVSGG